MGNRKTLGNIGLGNFCKAVLEHKNLHIYNDYMDCNLIWSDDKYYNNDGEVITEYEDEEVISLFLFDIYNLNYTFEIL